MNQIHIEKLTSEADFLKLRDEYEIFFINSGCNNIFLSPEWIFCWYRNYCKRIIHPFVISARDSHNTLVGVWLLVKVSDYILPKLKGTILKPMGYNRSEYCEPLYLDNDEQVLFAMIDSLQSDLNHIDLADIDRFPAWSICAQPLLSRLHKKAFHYVVLPEEIAPYISIKCDFEKYFLKQFSSQSRYNLRSRKKQLTSQGDVLFSHIDTEHDFVQALKQIKEIENKSWKGEEQKGIFSDPDSDAFFQEVLPILFKKRCLYLSVLSIDGVSIAYNLGFCFRKRSSFFNGAYLPEYSKYAPGITLLAEVINKSFEQNDTHFDFLRGASEFKFRWTSLASKNHTIKIFGNTFSGKLFYYLFTLSKPFRRRVRTPLPASIAKKKLAQDICIDSLE